MWRKEIKILHNTTDEPLVESHLWGGWEWHLSKTEQPPDTPPRVLGREMCFLLLNCRKRDGTATLQEINGNPADYNGVGEVGFHKKRLHGTVGA